MPKTQVRKVHAPKYPNEKNYPPGTFTRTLCGRWGVGGGRKFSNPRERYEPYLFSEDPSEVTCTRCLRRIESRQHAR